MVIKTMWVLKVPDLGSSRIGYYHMNVRVLVLSSLEVQQQTLSRPMDNLSGPMTRVPFRYLFDFISLIHSASWQDVVMYTADSRNIHSVDEVTLKYSVLTGLCVPSGNGIPQNWKTITSLAAKTRILSQLSHL